MPLEAGDGYISGLTITNPVGATDPKSQGDDHIRLIKAALKGTFPNLTGAVTLTQSQLNEAARLSAENVFTGATQTLSSIRPSLRLTQTDATADEGRWNLEARSDQLLLETLSDAGSSGTALLTAVRTGNTATLALVGTTLTLNGINVTDFARLSQSNTFASGDIIINAPANQATLVLDSASTPSGDQGYYDFGAAGVSQIRIFTYDASAASYKMALVMNAETGALDIGNGGTLTLNSVNISDYARLSQSNTFTGNAQTIASDAANPSMAVTTASTSRSPRYVLTNSAGTWITYMDAASSQLRFHDDTTDRFAISNGGNFDFKAGTVTTNNASASEVGFKGMPQNSQSDNYTLVLADAGKYILETGSSKTITIPANGSVAFPVGTVITIEANETLTIAITTDTLYLAGTNYGTTGSRTLARGGLATILKRSSTSWIISGTGLT